MNRRMIEAVKALQQHRAVRRASVLNVDQGADDTATLRFQCNICSTWATVPVTGLGREDVSCDVCQSTPRLRAMARGLSVAVCGQARPLADLPHELVGIGLSDHWQMAYWLAQRFTYQNTYFHQDPRLDITAPTDDRLGSVDFLLSSDVFEHVLSPVQRAFDGAFAVLRPGGWLILTVPHIPIGEMDNTVEHFGSLHEWTVERRGPNDSERVLVNITPDGQREEYGGLVFHGGAGETLEMRLFAESSLLRHLQDAGFTNVQVLDDSDLQFGISWGNSRASVPIIAQRPT
jgi:SAM-dependent methyltransferase